MIKGLDENIKGEMLKLKCRVVANARNNASSALNQPLDSRKRKMKGDSGSKVNASDAVNK